MNHCRSKKWYKWYCSRHVWFPEEITLRSVSSSKCFITLWFIQHMEFFGTKSPCIDCGLATTCYYCNKNALTEAWIQFCFLGLSENLEEHPQSWWFKSDFPPENGHILKIWELPNGRTHLVLLLWFNWAQTCTGSLQPTVTLWPNIIRGPSSSQTASERHASLWGHKGALKVSASTGFTVVSGATV